MLTDVTIINYYQDFLDASAVVYVNEAQVVNQYLFRLSLTLVVISVILYGFKFRKSILNIKKSCFSVIVSLVSLIFSVIGYQKMFELNELYLVTDISWPTGFPITAEQMGYVEPSHFFVNSGLFVYRLITITSVIFLVTILTILVIQLKQPVDKSSLNK
jgi:hypothetical protein